MRKLACIVLEVEDDQKLDDFIKHIQKFEPRLVYTAKRASKENITPEEKWNDRYKEIMSNLGISMSLAGYNDVKAIIECLHKMPNAKLDRIYDIAEKKHQRAPGTMGRTVRYTVQKAIQACGVEGVGKALGLKFKPNMKFTNKNFLRYLHDAVYNN